MTTLRARAPQSPIPAKRTMRAAVITSPGVVRIEDHPIPEPGPTQVRIRLQGCGVCGSNIPVWQGRDWFKYPLPLGQPGHEGYGIIDAMGQQAATINPALHIGARVGALSYNAFAEFDLAEAVNTVPLPSSLHIAPVPAEPLACAINAARRCEFKRGDAVAIVGFGYFGALIAQLALGAGATVIALSRRPDALAIAKFLGVQHCLPSTDHDHALNAVKSIAPDNLCDTVIEAAGLQSTLDLATKLTKERGRLVIAGFHQDGPRTVDMFLWNWRGLDVINAHERDPRIYTQGMHEAMQALQDGRLDPAPLHTHFFPLERLADALNAAATRPAGFMKAIVTMDQR